MPCCPEHCCNWDDCECADCDACIKKPQIQPQQPKPIIQEPVKIILLGNNSQIPKKIENIEKTEEKSYSEEYKENQKILHNISFKEEHDLKHDSFKEEVKKVKETQKIRENVELVDNEEEYKHIKHTVRSPKAAGNSIFGIRYLKNKK